MSILSTFELLQNIAKSVVTSKHRDVQQFYFKGWSTAIGLDYRTLGTIAFTEIHLPTSDEALQISSSNTSDTSISVLVKGYDSSFADIQEVVVTNASNARTPVSLTNSYFRINQMRIVSPIANVGDIYLTKDGSSLTNGRPANQSDYIYSMRTGDSVAAILNGCLKPIENGLIQPNYVVYSIANDTRVRGHFKFQMKPTNSSLWGTEFNFFVDERSNTQFTWRLDGVPDIPNDDLSKGYDVRIQGRRTGTGALDAAAAISIRQVQEFN